MRNGMSSWAFVCAAIAFREVDHLQRDRHPLGPSCLRRLPVHRPEPLPVMRGRYAGAILLIAGQRADQILSVLARPLRGQLPHGEAHRGNSEFILVIKGFTEVICQQIVQDLPPPDGDALLRVLGVPAPGYQPTDRRWPIMSGCSDAARTAVPPGRDEVARPRHVIALSVAALMSTASPSPATSLGCPTTSTGPETFTQPQP